MPHMKIGRGTDFVDKYSMFMEVGYVDNDDGTLTVFVPWFEI